MNAGRHGRRTPAWVIVFRLMLALVLLLIGLEGLREVLTGHLK